MDSKREQAMVGLFVVVATGLLLATVFKLSGVLARGDFTYRTYFKFAAGLQPGTTVSYAGVKVGRLEELHVAKQEAGANDGRGMVEVILRVKPDTPVKADSVVRILSLSALGENQIDILPGSATAARAADGAILPSKEFYGLPQIAESLEELSPEAKRLLQQLNTRVSELQVTISRVTALMNDQNRSNLNASLADIRGMLQEDRPIVHRTLTNVETTSNKMPALMDDLKKAIADAKTSINHIDEMVGENKESFHKSVEELRRALASAESAMGQIDRTLNYNAQNIDEILDNIRMTTENLKQFTNLIKQRPASLLHSSGPPDRKPGEPPKQQ